MTPPMAHVEYLCGGVNFVYQFEVEAVVAFLRRGHIWYTLCYTSRDRRELTGGNHHVTLPAGINQGYSSRSGVRVGHHFNQGPRTGGY